MSIVTDSIWAVVRPNGSNEDVQQVIFLGWGDQLMLSYIGYRSEREMWYWVMSVSNNKYHSRQEVAVKMDGSRFILINI